MTYCMYLYVVNNPRDCQLQDLPFDYIPYGSIWVIRIYITYIYIYIHICLCIYIYIYVNKLYPKERSTNFISDSLVILTCYQKK